MVLVTPPGQEKDAIIRLARTGIDCVVGYLDGGLASWQQAGFDLAATKQIDYSSEEEFRANTEGHRIVDVRNLNEWHDGVLDHAHL